MDDVPTDDDDKCAEWLQKLFQEKVCVCVLFVSVKWSINYIFHFFWHFFL